MDLKSHFPIFTHQPNLIYLDSAATALKPQVVIDAMSDYYSKYSSNIHRGLYPIAEQASAAYEHSREVVAKFINAPSPSEIIFTRSTTESLNLLAYSLTSHLTAKDIILTTHMEHHANLIPWQELANRTGATLDFIPLTSNPTLTRLSGSMERSELLSGIPSEIPPLPFTLDLTQLPTSKFKLLAISHVSNTLGTILRLKSIIQLIKQHSSETIIIVDGAQAIAHLPIDVQDLGCDAYVFSGHKLYGPTGIGVLWAKSALLDQLPPFNFGGDMIDHVTFESATYQPAPSKFEAGTPHIAGAIGLAAAINWLQEYRDPEQSTPLSRDPEQSTPLSRDPEQSTPLSRDPEQNTLPSRHPERNAVKSKDPFLSSQIKENKSLKQYALNALQSIKSLTLYGTTTSENRIGTFSFSISGIHPHDLAQILAEQNICIRAGHHCTMPLHREILQVPATARISLGVYNTPEDIDICIQAIHKAVKLLS